MAPAVTTITEPLNNYTLGSVIFVDYPEKTNI